MSHQCHCQPLPSLLLPPEARGGSKNRAMIRRPLLRSANFATRAPGTTPGSSDWWISSWPNWSYWLVNRDPYNGLLKFLYNWVGFHPLYNPTNQGIFHGSTDHTHVILVSFSDFSSWQSSQSPKFLVAGFFPTHLKHIYLSNWDHFPKKSGWKFWKKCVATTQQWYSRINHGPPDAGLHVLGCCFDPAARPV